MEKQEKKEKNILTDNRMATVNKRECSFRRACVIDGKWRGWHLWFNVRK